MAEIYAACHAVLRPGGPLVVVTKNTRARAAPSTWPGSPSPSPPGRVHLPRPRHRPARRHPRRRPRRPPLATGRSPRSATPERGRARPSRGPRGRHRLRAYPSTGGGRCPLTFPSRSGPPPSSTARTQRAGRYVEISGAHPAKMLPAIAAAGHRHLHPARRPGRSTRCAASAPPSSKPSTSAATPSASSTSRAGPSSPGPTSPTPAAQGATGHGEVVCGDARHLAGVVDPAVRGLVALVLTSPPYGPSLHGQVTARPGQGIAKAHDRYSTDPANLAHVGLDRAPRRHAARSCAGCAALLRPGGFVAMTVRPWWHAGQLIDLPGALVGVGEEAGPRPLRAQRRPPGRPARRPASCPGPRSSPSKQVRKARAARRAPPGDRPRGFPGL